jgi:preprotein translocase subunit Sec61beta
MFIFYFKRDFFQKLYKTQTKTTPKVAKDNKIRMPSGQGGLTRYFDEYKSKIEFSPAAVIVMAIVIMILTILLHYFGGQFFQ